MILFSHDLHTTVGFVDGDEFDLFVLSQNTVVNPVHYSTCAKPEIKMNRHEALLVDSVN